MHEAFHPLVGHAKSCIFHVCICQSVPLAARGRVSGAWDKEVAGGSGDGSD